MASLSLKNIYKVYPNGFNAVKDFNLKLKIRSSSSSLDLQDVVSQQHFV